jgi:hypothetical protein
MVKGIEGESSALEDSSFERVASLGLAMEISGQAINQRTRIISGNEMASIHLDVSLFTISSQSTRPLKKCPSGDGIGPNRIKENRTGEPVHSQMKITASYGKIILIFSCVDQNTAFYCYRLKDKQRGCQGLIVVGATAMGGISVCPLIGLFNKGES